MVHVCDSIMGSGKSSSIINYMNEHSDRKFIYITPFLNEAARIKDGCPELEFVEPSDKIKEYGGTKFGHAAALINQGRNITSTHQAFKSYNETMLNSISEQEYTLIIDENLEMLQEFSETAADMRMAVNDGYITYKDGYYRRTDKPYEGGRLSRMLSAVKNTDVTSVSLDSKQYFYWLLSSKLIKAFKEVFILTYLFEGQSIFYFLTIHNIKFDYIGVELRDGKYQFCEAPGSVPDYVKTLSSKIHILDDDRLNNPRQRLNWLSATWYKSARSDDINEVKNNIYNFFRNKCKGVPAKKRLWSVYEKVKDSITSKGYKSCYLAFNCRATNDYQDRTCLAYACNVYVHVPTKRFYEKFGVEVDDDMYALSTMVQWIWRSAIRNGEDIYLYLPSKRMRKLLTDWINEIGGDQSNEN